MKIIINSFTALFQPLQYKLNIHQTLCAQIKKEIEFVHPDWFQDECKDHHLFIMKKTVLMKIFYSVKWKSADIRDQALLRTGMKRKQYQQNTTNQKLKKLKHL